MRVATESTSTHGVRAAPVAMVRAGCVAVLVCVNACGGGKTAKRRRVPCQRQDMLQLAPAQLVVGAPAVHRQRCKRQSRELARGAQRQRRWPRGLAGRRRHASQPLGQPLPRRHVRVGQPDNIEASSSDIDDFDLTVDASGNAVVVWHEPTPSSGVPVGDERALRGRCRRVGRAGIAEQRRQSAARHQRCHRRRAGRISVIEFLFAGASSTLSVAPGSLKRGSGGVGSAPAAATARCLCWTAAAMRSSPSPMRAPARGSLRATTSHAAAGAGLSSCSPNEFGLLGDVPGSFTFAGSNDNVQLAASAGGDFLLAWEMTLFGRAREQFRDPHRAFHESHPDVECGADAGAGQRDRTSSGFSASAAMPAATRSCCGPRG